MLQHSTNPQDVRLSPEETRALLGVYQTQYEDGTTLGNVAETIGANPHDLYVMLEQMRAQQVKPVSPKRKTALMAAAGIGGALLLYGAIWVFWIGNIFARSRPAPYYSPTIVSSGPSLLQYENLMGDHQYKQASQMGWQILPQSWGDPTKLNQIAWLMVDPDNRPSLQDLKLAKKAAERAVTLTGGDDWRNLDTLAAVYNDMGAYGKAADTELKSLLKADSGNLDSVRDRLKSYYDASEAAKSGVADNAPATTASPEATSPDASPVDTSTSH
jgi:hypothetical protein